MSLLRLSLFAAIGASLLVGNDLKAQLPRGGAAERDRGLLGRMGERRDERLNRGTPPAGPNPNGLLGPAQANAARAAQAQAAQTQAAAANLTPAQRAALGYPRGNNFGLNPQGNRLPSPNTQVPQAAPVPQAQARSAYYAPSSNSAQAFPQSKTLPAFDPNAIINSAVRQASAPPNSLPYAGPGVLIRLPVETRGEVNYLVDDTEHLIVHAGEDQLLRLKGNYEVRFSRGVSADGRSYGEGRYTVTEGVYRFEVTAKGWELFREGEASDVRVAIERAEQRELAARSAVEQASNTSSSVLDGVDIDGAIRAITSEKEISATTPASLASPKTVPALPSPAPSSSTSTEETLPAPRSILEPT